ncbi:MAG TPA: glutamate--tRNA ligase [Candidatus Acidoferrales bacterium]|nr:glutamate--tRNA ligase [Candidatus Acidoferrales bacterium]
MSAKPRVRFAPSPTGFLHVGGARTALFNYLYARKHGGTYVLRVEDTDAARERPEYREEIFRALNWLGLQHDEGPDVGGAFGPYNQRERLEGYRAALDRLVGTGRVYPCFCASRADDVAQDDEPLQKSSACQCSSLSANEIAMRTAAHDVTPAMRFRIDATRTYRVTDLIRGEVEFPPGEVEDFIIVKAGGDPLYNFAAVVDDAAMKITHVIRGEEHLANTPKQIALYEALGEPVPQFAHLPIILNAERKKLSKRDGATGVSEYRTLGYLPDALVNFLALLGWSPPGGELEIMSREQMIELFDLDRVQKHGAIFDVVKLAWMNGEYIRTAPLAVLVDLTIERLANAPDAARLRTDRSHVQAACELLRERIRTIDDLVSGSRYLFTTDLVIPWDEQSVAKRAGTPEARERLHDVADALREIEGDWTRTSIEGAIRGLAERKGIKAGEFIGATRVAITGVAVSAGLFETAEVLGRDITLGRIDAFLRVHPAKVTA